MPPTVIPTVKCASRDAAVTASSCSGIRGAGDPAGNAERDGRYFGRSTLFEVYSIQGIPTLTEGGRLALREVVDSFSHGESGLLDPAPDNPLRIARDLPVELRNGQFDIGSTKDEVRAVQGTPVTETETVWDYGPSRVYFQHNRVVRWKRRRSNLCTCLTRGASNRLRFALDGNLHRGRVCETSLSGPD